MATSITVLRVRRPLSVGMFADLGFPVIAFSVVDETFGQVQVDVTANLTAAQIQRVKIRLQTWDTTEETTLVNAMNMVSNLDTIIATTGTLTSAQLSNHVRTLAQAARGIIVYTGKDTLN